MSDNRNVRNIEWQTPSSIPNLPQNGTVIWRLSPDSCRERENEYRSLLDPAEIERSLLFTNRSLGMRFAATRAILKWILSQYTGIEISKIKLETNENGKPGLPSIQFNISHSRDLALLAFNRDNPIGVDIEFHKQRIAIDRITRRFFAPSEIEEIDSYTDLNEQRDAFFSIWTRKEAYVKARGTGIFQELKSLKVPLRDRILHDRERNCNWEILSFEPAQNYSASICVQHTFGEIFACDWSVDLIRQIGDQPKRP